jgi:hypothetical protein
MMTPQFHQTPAKPVRLLRAELHCKRLVAFFAAAAARCPGQKLARIRHKLWINDVAEGSNGNKEVWKYQDLLSCSVQLTNKQMQRRRMVIWFK